MRNVLRAGGALALDRRLDRRLVFHQYLGRHARAAAASTERSPGWRCGRRYRSRATAAACRTSSRKTNTISSTRRATPKAPTGSSKWICCGVTCAAISPKSSAPPPCKRTKQRARGSDSRDGRRTVERAGREPARDSRCVFRRRQRRDGARAAAGRVPHARLQAGAVDAGRFAGRFDGDGARSHRRLERSRAPRSRVSQGRLSRTGRAFSVYRSVLRRAGHRRPRRDGTGARVHEALALLGELGDTRRPLGSNEWAAGAGHTSTGRALLANDPHLGLRIPGVWYLLDLRAPGFHAAGASLPGSPGIVLGHNDRIAWAATNGTVATLSVFNAPRESGRFRAGRAKRFTFACTATRRSDTIAAATSSDSRPTTAASSWCAGMRINAPSHRCRHFSASIARRRWKTRSRRCAGYPGPTQNFALAEASGRAAYQLAGVIPNDPAWARWIHPSGDSSRTLRERSVRRIAEGCAVARRDRVDRQQQDVRRRDIRCR